MIAVIDYGAGNIRSVENAFERLGKSIVLTSDRDTILAADRIVLPGVGAFGDAMRKLNDKELVPVIREAVLDRKIPFLGICLGLQLLFEGSDESPGEEGLCLLPGRVKRFIPADGLKIPQIGWNNLLPPVPGGSSLRGRLLHGIPAGSFFYFVHSYCVPDNGEDFIAASCAYGIRFVAAAEKDNIFACQFHPEKSGETGLRILENFIQLQ